MSDRPDDVDGEYDYAGRTFRIEPAVEGVWRIYDDDQYLGILAEAHPVAGEAWEHYTAKLAGEENTVSDVSTDDWRAALEYLVDASE